MVDQYCLMSSVSVFERWMAVASLVIVGSSLTKVIPLAQSPTARFVVAAVLGFALGYSHLFQFVCGVRSLTFFFKKKQSC